MLDLRHIEMRLLLLYIQEIIDSLFDDDFANIHFDTFGDARNNIGLTSNLYGSQGWNQS